MIAERRLTKKIVELSGDHTLVRLLRKKAKKNPGRIVAEKYFQTPRGIKYAIIIRNGNLYVKGNVLPEGDYDEDFKDQTIIKMFEKRLSSYN